GSVAGPSGFYPGGTFSGGASGTLVLTSGSSGPSSPVQGGPVYNGPGGSMPDLPVFGGAGPGVVDGGFGGTFGGDFGGNVGGVSIDRKHGSIMGRCQNIPTMSCPCIFLSLPTSTGSVLPTRCIVFE
ncbi:hypothetical protein MAR_033519, partial [Mya arenaria]